VRVFANAVKGQMEAYEITAELPGLDEKNIEVKLANGVLSIKGEKREEKEEKRKDYYRRERSFGSFEGSAKAGEKDRSEGCLMERLHTRTGRCAL
jgi:HSP20 family molecular chaperone IbpA